MEEQLITFETAKLAKEKSFNEYCQYWYCLEILHKNEDISQTLGWNNRRLTKSDYSAPTQSLLQKWLREKHELVVTVEALDYFSKDKEKGDVRKYYFFIHEVGNRIHSSSLGYNSCEDFKSYEEALEVGLQKALKQL